MKRSGAKGQISDIKLVMDAVYLLRGGSRRRAMRAPRAALFAAYTAFCDRATPGTWARLVAASRCILRAHRADEALADSRRAVKAAAQLGAA